MQSVRTFRFLVVLALLLSLGTYASAQFRGGSGERGRGGRGGPGGSGDSGDFRRRMMERMDSNGNGVLEPNEISDRARGFVERMARDAGLDPRRPMPVSRLVGGSGDRGRRDGRQGSSSSSSQDEYPLISGFGEAGALGFGVNPLSLDGRVIDLEKRYDRRVLESVERTMSRYDKNGNGILDHNEWGAIPWRGADPRESDSDGDGRLTKAELAERTSKRNSEERESRSRSDLRFSMFSRGGDSAGGSRFGGDRGDRRDRGGRDGDRGGRDGGRRGTFGRGGGGGFDPSAILSRFDKDGDGVIKPDELDERTRGFASRILERIGVDAKKPFRIDEVRRRFQERSNGQSSRNAKEVKDENNSDAAFRIAGVDRFKGRKSFRSAGIELPKNLPTWWDRKDENEDGQVSMAEFLTTRSARAIQDFTDYDLNRDGIITAREAEIVELDN